MKVAFIFGGMTPYLVALLNLLQKKVRNLEIVVILPQNKSRTIGNGVWQDYKDCQFRIVRTAEYLFWWQKPYLKGLLGIFEQEQPQVVVLGWPFILGYFFDLPLRLWLKKNQVKTIYRSIPYQLPPYHEASQFYSKKGFYDEKMNHIVADTWKKKLKYWLITKINKWYFNWVDAHLNYTTAAYDILPTYGVPKEKIFVSYNSGNTDELLSVKNKLSYEQKIIKKNKKTAIHVGRLVKWKKVDLLIEAFAKVIREFPEAELLIVGDGEEKSNLQQQAQRLSLQDKVRFVGAVHQAEKLGAYLLESTVYVLAGAGGLSINDAMTFGKPVICSVADGTEKDLVIEGQTGLYFKENDPEDLAEKILFCFRNEEIAKQMGKNAENLILNKINIHTVAERFMACFNFVTKNLYQLKYEP